MLSEPSSNTSKLATPVTVRLPPVVKFPAIATVELLDVEFGVTVRCET